MPLKNKFKNTRFYGHYKKTQKWIFKTLTKDKDRKLKEKYDIETGYFENGLPYARMGDKNEILIEIEALSFIHKPPSGMMLKEFIKSGKLLTEEFTYYLIGRRPNLPEGYLFDQMAEDYADLIRKKFMAPVNIMGTSTGGQIAQYLAADHPDVIKKLVLISTAYRLSEEGAKIEQKAADYFKRAKYGKSMTAITDMIYSSRILKAIMNPLIFLFGRKFIGDIKYPNDFLNEIRGDGEMNFINRLKDIKVPTLVLSGANDIGYTAEDVSQTAEGIPNAELKLYEKFGHNLVMRNRKKVMNNVMDFLKG